jgi:predicted hotdog family 3-hydroxylacyl-ACP dehydratase
MNNDTIDFGNPSNMFLRSIDIHTLLPQQEPFVMIQKLTLFNAETTITQTQILEDNIFVENGLFSCSGLIENIAQTCAARIGYVNKYILKKGIQLGFIGAIRNFEFFESPIVGETITTRVDIMEEVFGMTLAKALITMNDRILVTTEMKIAVKEDNNEV